MNLIIDIGNTKIKISLFKKGKLFHTESLENDDWQTLKHRFASFGKFEKAIISSVQNHPNRLIKFLKTEITEVLFLDSNLPTPLENKYESKNTLGYDRLAACVGAFVKYPQTNLLVIDAGTALTYDFVNEKGEYIGGTISPGLDMRFKSLHRYTNKLPQLCFEEQHERIGKNTKQAIVGGVQNGLLFEVSTYMKIFCKEYKALKVILTGGNAFFLHQNISEESQFEPNITALGLNEILEYNSEKQKNF